MVGRSVRRSDLQRPCLPSRVQFLPYAYRLITTYLLTLVKLYRKKHSIPKGPWYAVFERYLGLVQGCTPIAGETPAQSRVSQAFIAPDAILNHRLTLVKHFKKNKEGLLTLLHSSISRSPK